MVRNKAFFSGKPMVNKALKKSFGIPMVHEPNEQKTCSYDIITSFMDHKKVCRLCREYILHTEIPWFM